MGVGGDRRDEAVGEQVPGGGLDLVAVGADERHRVELGERAGGQLAAQAGAVVEQRVGAALGVGDQHAEAAGAQLAGGGMEVVADALEGRLDQQPAGAGRAVGDRLQLVLAEPADHVVSELAAAVQLERDPLGGEACAQLGHEPG